MRLSPRQLAPLVRGAVRHSEEDGWLRLDRFTERQTEAYRATGNPDFLAKSFASAGMRLSFRTGSRRLRFRYRLRMASSRPFAWFDLYQDGVMTGHFGTAEAAEGHEGEADVLLDGGDKLVELYFPWSCRTDLRDVELDEPAGLAPAFRPRTLLAYGDSITQGYDAVHPSLAYTEQFASMIGADVVNKAIAADCFFPELLDGEDLGAPDLVTVAYGTNDWCLRTRESTAARAGAFLRKIASLYPRTPVLAISPVWRGDWDDYAGRPFGAPATAVDALVREASEGLGNVTVLRGWPFVPHLPEFFSDRWLHPNDLGFGSYAKSLYRAAREAGRLP